MPRGASGRRLRRFRGRREGVKRRYGELTRVKPMKCEAFDNVWDAIEDNPATPENLKLRSDPMVTLTRHIKRNGLTQSQAAKLLGITQHLQPDARQNQFLRA